MEVKQKVTCACFLINIYTILKNREVKKVSLTLMILKREEPGFFFTLDMECLQAVELNTGILWQASEGHLTSLAAELSMLLLASSPVGTVSGWTKLKDSAFLPQMASVGSCLCPCLLLPLLHCALFTEMQASDVLQKKSVNARLLQKLNWSLGVSHDQ